MKPNVSAIIISVVIATFIVPAGLSGQVSVRFDDYFLDSTMRIDYYHTGSAQKELITIAKIYRHTGWAGNPHKLLDPFGNGFYRVEVYDIASNKLLFSRGYSTMFAEYRTTKPALNGTQKTFQETICIPCPKRPIQCVLEKRDRNNIWYPVFHTNIDPHAVSIIREPADRNIRVYEKLKNGDPHHHVDLVFVAEGYSSGKYVKFRADLDRFVRAFFAIEPYKSNHSKFNIYGVFLPSCENGMDEPTKGIFKSTVLDSTFNSFDLPRYLLTEENWKLQDIALAVPCDTVFIMVNSPRYGGGGIYNFYGIATVDNRLSETVFLHEFGHSFSGLADEYYDSTVAYSDFYPAGVEPVEANITALLAPDDIKWKHLLSKGIAIPTPYGRDKIEALQKQIARLQAAKTKKIQTLQKRKKSPQRIKALEDKFTCKIKALQEQITTLRNENREKYRGQVGAFEGAGYASKGLYRPEIDCMMFSNRLGRYCTVCRETIKKVISHYTN